MKSRVELCDIEHTKLLDKVTGNVAFVNFEFVFSADIFVTIVSHFTVCTDCYHKVLDFLVYLYGSVTNVLGLSWLSQLCDLRKRVKLHILSFLFIGLVDKESLLLCLLNNNL